MNKFISQVGLAHPSPQLEIQREITLMLDSFEKPIAREIMTGLAARYGFELRIKPPEALKISVHATARRGNYAFSLLLE